MRMVSALRGFYALDMRVETCSPDVGESDTRRARGIALSGLPVSKVDAGGVCCTIANRPARGKEHGHAQATGVHRESRT